jgi:hypothetical protein
MTGRNGRPRGGRGGCVRHLGERWVAQDVMGRYGRIDVFMSEYCRGEESFKCRKVELSVFERPDEQSRSHRSHQGQPISQKSEIDANYLSGRGSIRLGATKSLT